MNTVTIDIVIESAVSSKSHTLTIAGRRIAAVHGDRGIHTYDCADVLSGSLVRRRGAVACTDGTTIRVSGVYVDAALALIDNRPSWVSRVVVR